MRFFATCPKGLEYLLRDELAALLQEAGFGVIRAVFPEVRTRSGNVVRGVSLIAATL